MSTTSIRKLSGREQDIMTTLYYYRGMTALQLTQKVHNSFEPRNSQKSMIHNYLKKLKNQKIITSKKLEDSIGLGSIYYLTPAGFQITKDLLNIEMGQIGEGYRISDQTDGYHTHADLVYGIYKPPLEQTSHHILLIDSLLKLDFIDIDEQINSRLSMYATREYEYAGIQGKLRPDGELFLSDGRCFFLEIDKGTEGYQQLFEKFTNYRNYLSQLDSNEFPVGILFITDEKRQMYGLKRRWTNILAAYINAMGNMAARVNLILSPLNQLEEKVLFEINRPRYNRLAKNNLEDFLMNQGYSKVHLGKIKPDNSLLYAIAQKNNQYQIVFSRVASEFESSSFSYFLFFPQVLNKIPAMEEVDSLTPLGMEQVLFYKDKLPYLPAAFPKDKWKPAYQIYTELLHEKLTFLPL